MKNLAPNLAAEIRAATADAQLYNGGPGIDYGSVRDAYAVNITMLSGYELGSTDRSGQLSADTEILIVERGSGDGVHGSWSGVSGYLDRPDLADPLRHGIISELAEEIGITVAEDLTGFNALIGRRFVETRRNGGNIHVIPVALVAEQKPEVSVDGREVSASEWVKIGRIAAHSAKTHFSDGYLENTLPGALAAFGIDQPAARKMMGF